MDIKNKIVEVNKQLEAGEPENISVDPFTKYTGYKPQAVIDALNEVFGLGGWGFEEKSNELNTDQTLAVSQVRVWLGEVNSSPTAWGQSRVTRGDLGDARKGAQTDALKKAFSYFGVGNKAYNGNLGEPKKFSRPATEEEINAPKPVFRPLPAKPKVLPEAEVLADPSGASDKQVSLLIQLCGGASFEHDEPEYLENLKDYLRHEETLNDIPQPASWYSLSKKDATRIIGKLLEKHTPSNPYRKVVS